MATSINTVKADGIEVFYRSAGDLRNPVLLLLHGFPTSSHQFRNLIPLLSEKYYVIAPDLPGFGFTTIPDEREYKYTFANIATSIAAFLDALEVKKFAMYIFDYGAPTGLRIALQRPEAITAIITQNGNAYEEGLGKPAWDGVMKYWKSHSQEDRDGIRPLLELGTTKWQYTSGMPESALPKIQPETYTLDQALMDRPGNKEIQLDLFHDYRHNVEKYPDFQEFFRKFGVPVLAVWGKNDAFFVPAGAEAFKRDVKEDRFELHLIDAGHFAMETNEEMFAGLIMKFLKKHDIV